MARRQGSAAQYGTKSRLTPIGASTRRDVIRSTTVLSAAWVAISEATAGTGTTDGLACTEFLPERMLRCLLLLQVSTLNRVVEDSDVAIVEAADNFGQKAG